MGALVFGDSLALEPIHRQYLHIAIIFAYCY